MSYLAPLLSTLLLIVAGRTRASFAILLAAVLVITGAVIASGTPNATPRRNTGRLP